MTTPPNLKLVLICERNVGESRAFAFQQPAARRLLIALDCKMAVEAGHDDVAAAGSFRAIDDYVITGEDAGAGHTLTGNLYGEGSRSVVDHSSLKFSGGSR